MYKLMKNISILALIFTMCLVASPQAFADVNQIGGVNAGANVEDVTAMAAGNTGDVGSNNTYEAANMNDGRGFPIGTDVQYGPVINYFGKPLPSSGFQPLEHVLMYECFFTEGSLKNILKDAEYDIRAELKVANEYYTPAAPATEDGKTKWIKVVIQLTPYEAANKEFIGFVTTNSDDGDTTSVEVMAKSALKAMGAGANVVHFSAQGAVRDVEAWGAGFGFNTTQASLHSNSNSDGNVSAAGFGISYAEAGTRDKPWLQGFALVDHDLQYPAIPMPEPVEEEVEDAPAAE